ncbi:MAG: DUF5106 domain-containing protein, partial [Muribaculaceae bacterium]|nr:DUF5106 domain-containing protein [Muribaculaceae bacterium]
ITPADSSLTRDREFMEGNAVNFFYLLPYATTQGRTDAISRILHTISADSKGIALYQSLAEQYLGDPESPLYNEDTYITSLQQLLSLPSQEPGIKMRAQFQLEMLSKNRPGMKGADFEFAMRDNTTTTLTSIVARPTILLFYDPECDHCLDAIDTLRIDTNINEMINAGRLDILAVCIEGDKEQWLAVDAKLPSSWISGFDQSDIIGSDIYYIQSMPAIYLLASDGTVTLKNPTLQELLSSPYLTK